MNEAGGWAGGVLAGLVPVDPLATMAVTRRGGTRRSMASRYASEAGETFVCRLVASHVVAIKAVLRAVPVAELPFQGGWDKFAVVTTEEQGVLQDASAAMLASARAMALEEVGGPEDDGSSSGSETD